MLKRYVVKYADNSVKQITVETCLELSPFH